jgi:hypothetical protein
MSVALDPSVRRAAFTSLGLVALLALLVAVAAVLLPLQGVQWWLVGCLSALGVVILAEVVLLVIDRREPDEEIYDFIIEADDEGDSQAR